MWEWSRPPTLSFLFCCQPSKMTRFPTRYIPPSLSAADKEKQLRMLRTSVRQYKRHKYFTRGKLASYTHKRSKHLSAAQKLYGIRRITPSRELARKTGCSVAALKEIVRKGEGAFYSSGSRPNQTPQSWGLARLASAITGGKASAVNHTILDRGCRHTQKAWRLSKGPQPKGPRQ